MKIVTAEQMRAIDRVSIDERGIPGIDLMRRAGRAVGRAVFEHYEPGSVAIVAGRGNNAGDGFVAACELHARGVTVALFLLDDPAALRGDAALAYADFARLRLTDEGAGCGGGGVDRPPLEIVIPPAEDPAPLLAAQLPGCDVIVDALFGTGLRGPLEGRWASAVAAINQASRAAGVPVLSIDIPSGLPAAPLSRGEADARPIVRAHRTVTIGLPKLGLVTGAGVAYTGAVTVEEINFPADLLDDPAITANLLTMDEARALLPSRDPVGHKGTFGKALILAGSAGMTGAAVLAARSAARSGAGLIYSAYPEPLSLIMECHLIEPVKLPLPGEARWFTPAHAAAALEQAAGMQAVALGPGLGQRPATADFTRAMLRGVKAPLVLDADGLNLIAGSPEILDGRPGPTVLTPHPGEAARLLGLDSAAGLESCRLDAFTAFCARHGCVAVLKGAQTVVTSPDGQRWINPTGGSGLAKGGSGDVLTGLITGLLAQGLPAAQAARLGVFIHGMAGDLAARRLTARAMLASDIIDSFSAAFAELQGK